MYYDYAIDIEYNKAFMHGAAVWGKLEPREKPKDKPTEGPDRKAFHEAYGDKIKRPEKEGDPIVFTG